jgi:hypothetical protein
MKVSSCLNVDHGATGSQRAALDEEDFMPVTARTSGGGVLALSPRRRASELSLLASGSSSLTAASTTSTSSNRDKASVSSHNNNETEFPRFVAVESSVAKHQQKKSSGNTEQTVVHLSPRKKGDGAGSNNANTPSEQSHLTVASSPVFSRRTITFCVDDSLQDSEQETKSNSSRNGGSKRPRCLQDKSKSLSSFPDYVARFRSKMVEIRSSFRRSSRLGIYADFWTPPPLAGDTYS